jgi:hypothetical protein
MGSGYRNQLITVCHKTGFQHLDQPAGSREDNPLVDPDRDISQFSDGF